MRIWIDIDRTTGVSFLKPIIERLRGRGHEVVVTARDYVQTLELLKLHGIAHEVIGSQSGGNKIRKVFRVLGRAFALTEYALDKRFDLGFSHGSRSQAIACSLAGIPSVVTYDYEFVSTGIFKRLSTRVIMPECVVEACFNGRKPPKYAGYPGLKEELYLAGFKPDEGLAERIGIDQSKIVFVVRPPAEKAHYHNPRSEFLLKSVIAHTSARKNVQVLVVPRDADQRQHLKRQWRSHHNVVLLEQAVDGPSLISLADAVMCAGGTMLREAAVLGVPAYSIFAGKTGAVDSYLESIGRVTFLRDSGDIMNLIRFEKRKEPVMRLENPGLVEFFIGELQSFSNPSP